MTTDPFTLLETQHRDTEALLTRAASTGEDATVREACAALTLHAEIEEQVLYPELRRIVDGGDDLADRAASEHAAVRTLIARFSDSPPAELAPLVAEIQQLVRAHVEFEERDIFPELREAPIDASALEQRLRAAEGEAPSRSSGTVG
jgi:hemerythrin superfamily protein